MTTENFVVRPMKRSEMDLAITWAATEGWNPGKYDAQSFYQTDESGFFLGELNGEPVGCISAVAYDPHFAVIGFYVVKPQFRGQGLGIKIWKTAMDYLGADRNIGLDGAVAQQDNYKKSGFKIAYNHIRYEGVGGGVVPAGIVDLKTVPFEDLVAYDRQFFPSKRSLFLQHWIEQPESIAFGFLKNGSLAGYGVIRPAHTGFRVGPLFANDEQIAEALFQALLAQNPHAPVFFDVPDANLQAIDLVQRYQLQPVSQTARMYTKEIPSLPINRIFAVTSVELG
ncbi:MULTISPECIES: GNAT family N-acetyltransferase [unclassified Nostoc]|uniref:GNAT family N-acetyltransferase n=1 Tax=unclassified Nostoc TaxID=2593658 RepID=UPI002AD46290|nr:MULTISPECIES: GNAT family N-acetyltransferase [unclassified Nostoc]MDZ8032830.1 GNAT family N-acetyltransferase [Nostoc sp. DedSLP04]MDZ8137991.1 GNAT family N-acetyltransferase [Nostoc sp. DedQUE04]